MLSKIDSYSQFINEAFDKNSIKDFCERYLAYLLDDEDYSKKEIGQAMKIVLEQAFLPDSRDFWKECGKQ